MTCCFIGHRKIKHKKELASRLRDSICYLLEQGVAIFLFGDHSEFNTLCYKVVSELREVYPQIRRIHYRTDYPDADAYTMQFLLDGYEDSICPDGVAAAGKAAYVERNQAMILASDFCVFYYSIADGIRDKNVLGFDPYKVLTFRDKDVRKVVALEKAKAATEEEAISNPQKAKIFYEYMDSSTVKMAGFLGDDGKWVKGIEDYLPKTQYLSSEHQSKVVEDIQENWLTLSHNGKFHAIFATSSIPEAIDYYRLLKAAMPKLRISCLFDPNISNEDGDYKEYRGQPIAFYKEQGLIEILTDYNMMFGQDFSIATHARFKKDLSLRLAHKEQYKRVEREPEKQLDLLIVVDQMLTGFDSKWVNTLYMDKILEYENIIQAFSRTNRLFGPDKPFGIIRYYRKPHTMEQNVSKAVKLYSGDRPIGLFVEKLSYNLGKLNAVFDDIAYLFKNAGIPDFEKLPADGTVRAKFASLFRDFNGYLEAAKIQ